jgi:NADPH-dependent 2,4-dienoyl-CoA reductase/sulfur reductase-like enzyme
VDPIRRVVVVGAGVGGVQTAESLRRRHGYDGELVLLDADDELPYNRPPLSKELITGELDDSDVRLLTPELVTELDIDLRLGVRARDLRPGEQLLRTTGADLRFDALVIATGSVPVLPRRWAGLAGVTTLRTLDDARTIRAALAGAPRVVVVGGGFIGCEIAAAARTLGADVTVVDAAPSLMSRVLDPRLSAPVEEAHRSAGVTVRCGTPVSNLVGGDLVGGDLVGGDLVGGDRVEAVELADGTRIGADLVVVGLGARPATGWLTPCGLGDRDGVRADATLRAAPGVYAVGDVVRHPNGTTATLRRFEHWTNAREHGALAAANLLDPGHARPVSALPFVWSDQHGRRLQVLGDGSGEQVRFVGTGAEDGFLAFVGTADRLTGVVAWDRPREFRTGRRLLESGAGWAAVGDVQW